MNDDNTEFWEVWNLGTRDDYGWGDAPMRIDGQRGRSYVVAEYARQALLASGEHRLALRTSDGALSIVKITVRTTVIAQIKERRA